MQRPRLAKGLLGLALAIGIVSLSVPARADDEAAPSGSAPREAPHLSTEGKVLIYSFAGVTAVSLAVMTGSLIARESAVSRHNDFPTNGGVTDCTTRAACDDLNDARDDADAWRTRAAVAGGIFIGAGITTALLAVFWPRETSARLTPSVSTAGASIGFQGRF
jgi:heme A synthase